LFEKIPAKYPEINFGGHFHNRYEDSYSKLKAAMTKVAADSTVSSNRRMSYG
jgi:hypothetical protein